jgi:ABC-type iron transport system FetAB permease component
LEIKGYFDYHTTGKGNKDVIRNNRRNINIIKHVLVDFLFWRIFHLGSSVLQIFHVGAIRNMTHASFITHHPWIKDNCDRKEVWIYVTLSISKDGRVSILFGSKYFALFNK